MSQRKGSFTPVNSAAAAARIMSGSSGASSGGIPPPPLSRPPPPPPPMTGGRGNAGRSYMGYNNNNNISSWGRGRRQGRGGRGGGGGGGSGNNNNHLSQQQQIQQLMAGGQQQQQQDGYYGNGMGVNSYGIGRGGQQQQQQHQQGGRGGRGNGGRGGHNNGSRGRGRGGGRGGGRGNGGGGRGRGDHNLKYDSSQYDRIEEINGVGVNTSDSKDGSNDDSDIVRIAIEGCCHGELDLIYDRLLDHEKQTKTKIDLLLCCGDFQSLRNELDFMSSSIPTKYQNLGTFCQYYSGQKKAPIPTIFIGGNHEASQSLRELYYGGYVASNIYFMGAAASIIYRGIRIGGISGIYKSFDYTQGHHERIPYDYKSNKSVYHTRNVDIERMKLLKSSTTTSQEDNKKKKELDIVLSHDWPLGIEQHGNTQALIRKKPFFRQEIQNNDLGSTPNREVLDTIQPKYWFAAHLHVKFHATVIHNNKNNNNNNEQTKKKSTMKPTSSLLMPSQATTTTATTTKKKNNNASDNGFIAFDENHADDTTAATAAPAPAPPSTTPITEFHAIESDTNKCNGNGNSSILDLTEQMTKFLALDKCLPRRQFLSLLNLKVPVVPVPEQPPPQNDEGKEKEIEIKEKEDNKNMKKKTKEYHIEYDPEWLAILKKTHRWNSTQRQRVYIPSNTEPVNDNDIEWVIQRFKDAASVAATAADSNDTSSSTTSFLEIPYNDFVPTVPYNTDIMFTGGGSRNNNLRPLPMMGNPQTDRLLNILDLNHILTIPYDPITHTPTYISNMYQGIKQQTITTQTKNNNSSNVSTPDSNEIDLDDLDDDDDNDVNAVVVAAVIVDDDNEINIDDDEDEDEDDALVIAVAIDDDDNDDDANAVVVAVAVYNNNNNNSNDDDNNDDDNEIDTDDDDDGDDDETMAKVTIKKARIEE